VHGAMKAHNTAGCCNILH